MSAPEHFSLRVAPDQSLLVLDSDATGKWPLVRLRRWWTNAPVEEVLTVPGWTSADAKYLDSIHVDVQVTPDGHYAVAFAGAYWMDKSTFLVHAPNGYIGRPPDTIITVIDLVQWKIVSSIHTMGVANGKPAGVRVVNDRWLLLDFLLGPSALQRLTNRYDSRLLSLPNLQAGASCVSDRPSRGLFVPKEKDSALARRNNDSVCKGVLQATGASSVAALETSIYRNQDVLPESVRQSSTDLMDTEDSFFGGWGEYPYFLFYSENPPYESASHKWYGLFRPRGQAFYDLAIFDAEGNQDRRESVRNLLCGDTSLEKRGSACGCRVVDASEQQNDLLALCRTQNGDYAGMVRKEWLAVLHVDDFSGEGVISLVNKSRTTLQGMAIGDGSLYVVTVESGNTLRVYATAKHPLG